MLQLELLGRFRLAENDGEIHLDQSRGREMLAYLALKWPQPVIRRELAFVLWPESTERQALTNLRSLFFKLIKAWPTASEYLQIARNHVAWRTEKSLAIDVVTLLTALAQAEQTTQASQLEPILRRAATAYGGELLPTHFDDWILVERERLQLAFAGVLERLSDLLEIQRRYDEAIVVAEQLRRLDPLHEASYRYLMRLHAARGDRAAALRVYHTCASLLERELGVPPNRATQELFTRLLHADAGRVQETGENAAAGAGKTTAQTGLVGRHAEWQQLLTAWQDACQGHARFVLICGEAGIGKTRLAEELVDKLLHQGHSVLSSRAYANEAAPAFGPISEWLRRQPVRAAVENIEPIWQIEVARLLPEILIAHPELPEPGPLREGWQRQRFYEGIVRLLLALPQPILLHIDDLQWCDQETLNLIHFLLRAAQNAQMLIVGTARNEDLGVDPPLKRLIAGLQRDELVEEIELGPLSVAETATLAEQTIDGSLSALVQDELYRESEGHPLFLIEMLRIKDAAAWQTTPQSSPSTPMATSQVTSQVTSPATSTTPQTATSLPVQMPTDVPSMAAPAWASPRSAIPPPPKIQAIIGARLAQLSPQAREVANLAAVVGREFSFSILQAGSSIEEEALVLAVDELWRRRIIREHSEGGYDFSHDRIREVAYSEISRTRRRFYHRRIAEVLHQMHVDNADVMSGRLAFHYESGDDSVQAVTFYLRAGEHAQSTYAEDRGLYSFNKALGLTKNPRARVQALSGLGRAYFGLDQLQTAIEFFVQALDLCEATDPQRAGLLYWLADAHFARYDADAAEPYVRSALAQAEASDDKETICQALSLLGQIHSQRGDLATEQDMIRRALGLARHMGNDWREGRTLADLGFLQAQCGDFAAAAASARQALNLLQASRDLAAQAFAWNILGRAEGGRGRYQAAFDAFEQCETQAAEINLHSMLAQIPNMRGWLLHQVCNYERAHQENLRGLEVALQTQKELPEISARLNLCLDAVSLQRFQEAYALVGEIEARLDQNDFGTHGWRWRLRLLHIKGLTLLALDRPDTVLALACKGLERAQAASAAKYVAFNHELLGMAQSALGRGEDSVAHLEKAIAVADRIQYQPLRWQARQALARHYTRHGNDAAATRVAHQAGQIVAAIHAELTDPEVRRIFLAHAEIASEPTAIY